MSEIHSSKYTFIIYYSKEIDGSRQGAKDLEQALIFATNGSSRVLTYDVMEKNHLKSLIGRDANTTRVYMVGTAPSALINGLQALKLKKHIFFISGDTPVTYPSSSIQNMISLVPSAGRSLRDNAAKVASLIRTEATFAPGDRALEHLICFQEAPGSVDVEPAS